MSLIALSARLSRLPPAFVRLAPVAAILGSILSLTLGTSLAKSLFPIVGPQGTVFLRVGFAALILGVVWRPWRNVPAARDLARMIAYGAVLGTMNLLFYLSLKTTPLGIAIAVEFMGPLTVALLASKRRLDVVWIGCAALGLVLLIPAPRNGLPLDPTGLGYAAAAAVFWGLYVVAGARTTYLPFGQTVSIGMATAALVALPFGVASAGASLLQPQALLTGIAVAVFSSALPYSLEMMALQRLPKQTFGVLLSLEPAVGAVVAFVVLHETLGALQWLAIGSIVLASVGATATAKPLERAVAVS